MPPALSAVVFVPMIDCVSTPSPAPASASSVHPAFGVVVIAAAPYPTIITATQSVVVGVIDADARAVPLAPTVECAPVWNHVPDAGFVTLMPSMKRRCGLGENAAVHVPVLAGIATVSFDDQIEFVVSDPESACVTSFTHVLPDASEKVVATVEFELDTRMTTPVPIGIVAAEFVRTMLAAMPAWKLSLIQVYVLTGAPARG